METKISKEKIRMLSQTALFESCMLHALIILLSGDRRHEDTLRMALSVYACSLPGTYRNGIEDTGIWDEYLAKAYALFVETAEERFKGFRDMAEAALTDPSAKRRPGRPRKELAAADPSAQ